MGLRIARRVTPDQVRNGGKSTQALNLVTSGRASGRRLRVIAAETRGRRARLSEDDAAYCDPIVRRWQSYAGATATLRGGNSSFAEGEAGRRGC